MEFALNIAWLILSAGLVLLCSTRRGDKLSGSRGRAAVIIALACLIAFLFPVISITDDLNGGAVLAESSKSKAWISSVELVAVLVTAMLAAFSAQRPTWADGSILCDLCPRSQEPLSFNLSRRPPPEFS